jgi:hypothetical protein
VIDPAALGEGGLASLVGDLGPAASVSSLGALR